MADTHAIARQVEPTVDASTIGVTQQSCVDPATVAVVITTFNHANYLGEAIASALAQTHPADEIIVVDDGSSDDPVAVVAGFPGVRLIRQDNRGLAAARNTGLRASASSRIIFLDADDRLLPVAIEAGLECAAKRPDCAFVYGGYRNVTADGLRLGPDRFDAVSSDAHCSLLHGNLVAMHATVLYRRDHLLETDGFDEALRRCEDYDLYLRLALEHPVACHQTTIAEYRKHGLNMSSNVDAMLRTVLGILDRHATRIAADESAAAALRAGRVIWREYYVTEMLETVRTRWRRDRAVGPALAGLAQAARWFPGMLPAMIKRRMKSLLLPVALWSVARLRRWETAIPVGRVWFGDLKRPTPISRSFGYDRGTPLDRYYIEAFLAENAGDIRGRVLEVGDNAYTMRFGGPRVERSDILHIDTSNPAATFVGDLAQADTLPEAAFDCIVLTQTLHLVFDMRAAVATLHRALKRGGKLLVTAPGITPIAGDEWGATWYWSLSPLALRRLLEEQFAPHSVAVMSRGNVFAATAFLYGVALEELDRDDLDRDDAAYPVIVTARATRTEAP